ncbi:PoNe immunity protein domain-containing protein [Pseudorhodoferax sp.]|uniref:PoNe immunity protein domain-containing protein n=1 Tax=Pseudorhodoferax sp. TaxID=1993553 RepID=UPI0039E2C6B0
MHGFSAAKLDKEFLSDRRDVSVSYDVYRDQIDLFVEAFDVHDELPIEQRIVVGELGRSLAGLSGALGAQSSNTISYLHLQYSAGASPSEMRDWYPSALAFWEEYAHYHEAFHQTPESSYVIAHMTLGDSGYWDAIRMTSFAILLGHVDTLVRLCAIWDYGDQPRDGLLERLIAPFVPGRAPPPDTCTRHLPYFKLLKVFDASPEKRPALMSKYMDEWYTASRREPYYGSQKKGREHSYLGLWSFEAAAVTYVLQIDDSSYRDKDFYPRDLVDYARSLPLPPELGGAPTQPPLSDMAFLRCQAGQACPREGWWSTPAKADSRRHFLAGETMPSVGGDYGVTIWQWDERQSD